MNHKDVPGHIFQSIHYRKHRLLGALWTPYMRLFCKLFGIAVGHSTVFYGTARIRRFRYAAVTIGNNCRFDSLPDRNAIGLKQPCQLTAEQDAKIVIGDDCGFGGTVLWSAISITIGNRVKIGANCLLLDHEGHPEDPRSGPPAPIIVEDDVWLGTNVVVLKGVTIGRGTQVGANSIVTKSLPPFSVAAGSPCRVIRALPSNLS